MKRAALVISAIVGVLLLAGVALMLKPPAGMIGARLAEQVRAATGRDFSVKGGTTVKLGWTLKVRMDDVALSNPAGVAGDPLLAARAIEVETPAVPALMGRADAVAVMRLVEPRVRLTRDASGKDNWTFTTTGSSTFAVRDLEVKGGRLVYEDAQSTSSAAIEGVDGSGRDVSKNGVGGFALTGTKAKFDFAGSTGVLDQPALAGKQATADAIGELEVNGAKLVLTGLGDGLEASLEAPKLRANGLTPGKAERLAERIALDAGSLSAKLPGGAVARLDAPKAEAANLKSEQIGTLKLDAAAAHYTSADGVDVALDGLGATGQALTPDEVGALVLDAKAARYKLSGGASGSLDTLHADQQRISPEKIEKLALTSAALKHTAADGSGIELTGLKAAASGLTPDGVAGLVLDAATVAYRLADGGNGTAAKLGVDGQGIGHDGITAIALKSDRLTYVMAGGTSVELAGLTANAKALTRQAIGEGALTASTFAAVDGAARYELDKVEASTKNGKLPGPLDVAMAFDWKGERVTSTIKLDALAMPAEGKPSPLSVKLATRGGTLALDGTLSAAREIDGRATLHVKSARDIAKWLGYELPLSGPLGAASVDGRVKASGKRLELADAALALDATKAKGSLVVDISGPRPRISGALDADTFDADTYGLTTAPKPDTAPSAVAIAADDEAVPPPPTLKEALKAFVAAEAARMDEPAAPAAAATQRTTPAWSNEPIDFSFLKKADVDLALSVTKLRVAGLDVGVPALATKLDDGILTLNGRDLAMKGGKVTGRAAIEARTGQPRAAANIKADNIEALDLFDALGLTRVVSGKSGIEADLGANVGSQKQLVESVTGSVKVKMGRGAVIGYEPSEILTYIAGNGRYDAKHRWPFSRLDADVSLDKGLSRNTKVVVDTAVAGANSDGTTDLPKREIDYKAKLNVSFWFQPILVRIFGAWNAPKWAADMFDTSRGAALASADNVRRLDIKDAELAAMIGELLEKSATASRPLDPAVAETLRLIKAQAEAR